MTVIGLTGKSGAGKNAVAEIFRKFGISHIDCDRVSRQVTQARHPCLKELAQVFPDAIRRDGSLNRKELAAVCFSNPEKLSQLNQITHKHILLELRKQMEALEQTGFSFVCVNGATLIESGFADECDLLICVEASRNNRLKRIMERDMLTRQEAERRIDAQHGDDFYESKADYVIKNNGNDNDLFDSAAVVARKIMKK